jgi:hypothetical protein
MCSIIWSDKLSDQIILHMPLLATIRRNTSKNRSVVMLLTNSKCTARVTAQVKRQIYAFSPRFLRYKGPAKSKPTFVNGGAGSDHPAVELFVQDIHRREMHTGVEHTLSVVRQRFWLIKGRGTIRKIVKRCIVCRQFYTKPVSQQMAPLPTDRLVGKIMGCFSSSGNSALWIRPPTRSKPVD